MKNPDAYRCWFAGQGWKHYPIQVATPRPVQWEPTLNPLANLMDARDMITTVWIGPEAPFPALPPYPIQMPSRVTMRCDWFTATDPDAKRYITEELLHRHPEIATAYLYETVIPKDLNNCTLIWKVWYHA